jgi:hypothetical protein
MIKKWIKKIIEFLFSEYLLELRLINMNLMAIQTLLAENKPEESGGFKPLQPLSQGGSIFTSPE